MSIAERKKKHKSEREARILAVAADIAARDGWDAVTIRRLADEIEYSQPVVYSHFESRAAIVTAVAVEGFKALAEVLAHAADASHEPEKAVEKVATAYCNFGAKNSALYQAMFVLPTDLRFGTIETKPELRAAFEPIAVAVKPFCADIDVEVVAETLWAALHGLVELERSGRVRPSARKRRITLVAGAIITR